MPSISSGFKQKKGKSTKMDTLDVAPITTGQKRFIQASVALLVASILTGTTLVLFAVHQQAKGGQSHTTTTKSSGISTLMPPNTPTPVSLEMDGLKLSVSITPGPYFLSELVAVSMKLNNPTETTYHIFGNFTTNICEGGALQARLTGGHDPSFSIPAEHFSVRCPPPDVVDFLPGQTGAILQYIPLEKSGRVTLNVYSLFAPITYPASDPLPSHSFTLLQLTVAPQIPVDRVLFVQSHGSDRQIIVPENAHPQLVYRSGRIFIGYVGCSTYTWQPLTTTILHAPVPSCTTGPGGPLYYAVGVVGYAVITGIWSS